MKKQTVVLKVDFTKKADKSSNNFGLVNYYFLDVNLNVVKTKFNNNPIFKDKQSQNLMVQFVDTRQINQFSIKTYSNALAGTYVNTKIYQITSNNFAQIEVDEARKFVVMNNLELNNLIALENSHMMTMINGTQPSDMSASVKFDVNDIDFRNIDFYNKWRITNRNIKQIENSPLWKLNEFVDIESNDEVVHDWVAVFNELAKHHKKNSSNSIINEFDELLFNMNLKIVDLNGYLELLKNKVAMVK